MAYALHIKRDGGITLEEWSAAVESVEGVRLTSEDTVITNPSTGERIHIGGREGDAEFFFPADSKWRKVMLWSRDSVTFNAPRDWEEPGCTVRSVAFALARALKARVTGDEGEEYQQ